MLKLTGQRLAAQPARSALLSLVACFLDSRHWSAISRREESQVLCWRAAVARLRLGKCPTDLTRVQTVRARSICKYRSGRDSQSPLVQRVHFDYRDASRVVHAADDGGVGAVRR